MHHVPNGVMFYDWGNTPARQPLPNEGKTETTRNWDGGDTRNHHIWWFDHIPKISGETHSTPATRGNTSLEHAILLIESGSGCYAAETWLRLA